MIMCMRKKAAGLSIPGHINKIVNRIIALRRPVTVGFIANHFAGNGAYAQFLLKDAQTTMRYADGSLPKEQYFRTTLAPFTLSTDEHYAHVRAMRDVLEVMAKAFARLEKIHPELVVGYAFNGETHFMFEDFFSGTGRFANARLTDFSESALNDFRKHLSAHPDPAITEAVNAVRSIRPAAYEWGTYPFFGWYCAAAPHQQLLLLKEGKVIAHTRPSLNRLDVYEAVPEIYDANCGFRFDVDFSAWPAGTYQLQVAVETEKGRYALANGQLALKVGEGGATAAAPVALAALPPALGRGYMDHGSATPISVRYRPLIRAWDALPRRRDCHPRGLDGGAVPQGRICRKQAL